MFFSLFSRIIPVFTIFRPEQVIQGYTQFPANADTKADRGIIIPVFNGIDGLAGYAQTPGKGILR